MRMSHFSRHPPQHTHTQLAEPPLFSVLPCSEPGGVYSSAAMYTRAGQVPKQLVIPRLSVALKKSFPVLTHLSIKPQIVSTTCHGLRTGCERISRHEAE